MLPKASSLLASCCAMFLGSAALSQETGTILLRPGAISYAPSGSSSLVMQRDWASLNLDLLAPQGRTRLGGLGLGQGFTHVSLGYSGNTQSNDVTLSLGQAWRSALSGQSVFGLNAYLDFGRKAASDQVLSQVSLGVEYERAANSGLGNGDLVFGSNLYLPFADYTATRFGLDDTSVPRPGMDSYVSWTRRGRMGFSYGTRFSIFHYPASESRPAQGIGTFSLTGEVTRGLPTGSAVTADLTGRYTPGEDLAPRFELAYRQDLVPPPAQGKITTGTQSPSRNCRIVEGETRLERLNCGRARYRAPAKHEVYETEGVKPEATVSVPAPERRLGYGGFYVP
ncbi:hypothetical protein [Pseudooceanicola algae]|uniref:Uncharacterized protein n=1 Tax=Pseudooceanicola algae TaxID=1537215 RepID=A0A418SJS1_9RHOB|nr:hypothetical protein [Pseudooceanicola algae]QPM90652.1 hypothetical protein PSAL_018910 [Pseudooceanicola algae]